ncbi:MAG TPA: OB-fold nucleic acid binding domain-containing protein, partial [Candidatus Melainabacteria bacterium]|nr:OB-fold nucleic acid binding domain-containing protein [Candidatus Melainabacteria bacterium]
MTSTVKTTDRIPVKEALCEESIGKKVKICGWVRTRRDSKAGFSFIELNDGSSFNSIQVVAPKELDNYESEILHAGIGSSLEILGEVVESPGKGQAT